MGVWNNIQRVGKEEAKGLKETWGREEARQHYQETKEKDKEGKRTKGKRRGSRDKAGQGGGSFKKGARKKASKVKEETEKDTALRQLGEFEKENEIKRSEE